MKEITITIQGKEVSLIYCAATENGFEELRGKSIYEFDFNSERDRTALGIAAIVASYARKGEEPPITSDVILYEATKKETIELANKVIELRAEWYDIPLVVANDLEREREESDVSEEEAQKN